MYFAMDEIGLENTEKIKLIDNESKRWKFIYEVAKEYGFNGIHFTPSLYNTRLPSFSEAIPKYRPYNQCQRLHERAA